MRRCSWTTSPTCATRRGRCVRRQNQHTWVISFLYIGTFGSFIGFGFAFGQVLQNQFGAHFLTAGKIDPVKIAYLTFLGPLIGSMIRPVGGWLADRVGGARTTFWNFVAMAAAAGVVLPRRRRSPWGCSSSASWRCSCFSGIGNGSTYKMIPAIFRAKGLDRIADGADPEPSSTSPAATPTR